jgi:hypothetical protein
MKIFKTTLFHVLYWPIFIIQLIFIGIVYSIEKMIDIIGDLESS